MPVKKMTPATHTRYSELVRQMYETLADFRHPALVKTVLPAEWREIKADVVPDRARITLRVDTDVAKFYRKLGRDYQATVNRVLRSFMMVRLIEMLGPPERVEVDERDAIGEAELETEVMLRDELERLRWRRLGR